MFRKMALFFCTMILLMPYFLSPVIMESGIASAENDSLKTFTNTVDGYSIALPADLQQNMDNSSVSAIFERDDMKVEVFKQYVGDIGSRAYINYSNAFLRNDKDHVLDKRFYTTIDGHEANVLLWHREKLSRVNNDRNYYLNLEIPSGAYVYSFFVKSDKPMWEQGDYMSWFNTFKIIKTTEEGTLHKTRIPKDFKDNWNDETRKFYRQYFSERNPLAWGIFQPDTDTGEFGMLKYYEDFFEYDFPVILSYSHFNDGTHSKLTSRLTDAYKHGKVVELALQTTAATDGGNMMYDILNGEYDYFLEDYAKQIADFSHPVLFRLFNEMNGDWCTYCAYHYSKDTDLFIETYKYIYGIFERSGANKNTIWVWNPNGDSLPAFKWNHYSKYYPGDEYVQIVGMTAYNTGVYYSSIGERWKEFSELYDGLYNEYAGRFAQPLMITEFASANAEGDKAAWIARMGEKIVNYKQIKMAVWWDGQDWDADGNVARSYIINENQDTMDAFKKVLKESTNDPNSWKKNIYAALSDRNKILSAHLDRNGEVN